MLFSTPAQKNTPQSIEAGVLVPSSEGGGRKSAGMMGDRRPVDPLDGPSSMLVEAVFIRSEPVLVCLQFVAARLRIPKRRSQFEERSARWRQTMTLPWAVP